VSATWPLAYYPAEDRYVDVRYLLSKRRPDDIRAGDGWDSREAFNDGEGIRLGPVDNESGTSVACNCIRAHRGQQELIERRARQAGYEYNGTNEFIRYSSLLQLLLRYLETDSEIQALCQIDSVAKHPRSGQMDAPDIVIKHLPGYILGEQTNILITDKNRRRPSRSGTFSLRINDWTQANVKDFDKYGGPLFIRYWRRYVRGIQKQQDADRRSELEAEEKAKREAEEKAERIEKAAIRDREEQERLKLEKSRDERIAIRKRSYIAYHEFTEKEVPVDRSDLFPHINCLSEVVSNFHGSLRSWPDNLQHDDRYLISKAENWRDSAGNPRIDIPRNYSDFSDLVNAAEGDLQLIDEHLTQIEEEKEQHSDVIDLIRSTGKAIDKSKSDSIEIRNSIQKIRSDMQNILESMVRAATKLRSHLKIYPGDSSTTGFLYELNNEIKAITDSREGANSLFSEFTKTSTELLNQATSTVDDLGLTSYWNLTNEYWWNDQIDTEIDLQTIASKLGQLDAAKIQVKDVWSTRISDYEEYRMGGDKHNGLKKLISDSADHAKTFAANRKGRQLKQTTRPRLRGFRTSEDLGRVLRLIGPPGNESGGMISREGGSNIFFRLKDVNGQSVNPGDEVKFVIHEEKARNRAVRVTLVRKRTEWNL